jgi:hypothetical protein
MALRCMKCSQDVSRFTLDHVEYSDLRPNAWEQRFRFLLPYVRRGLVSLPNGAQQTASTLTHRGHSVTRPRARGA